MSISDLSAQKAAIRETLAQDSISEAIRQLKQWLPKNSRPYQDLLLIEGRQNEANRQRLRDVVSDRELQVTYNQIRADLMELIDGLQSADFAPSKHPAKVQQGKKARMGEVLHRIPRQMKHLKETRCVVRIATDDETIIRNIDLDEHVQLQSVCISDVMQVELSDQSAEPAFQVRAVNSPEQVIYEEQFTEWTFYVKPLRIGTFPLLLKISVIEMVYGKERKYEQTLEQSIDIVTIQPEEETTFQPAGLYFSLDRPASPSDIPQHELAPPNLNPLRGRFARRAALSLAILMSFVGGAWAVTPTQVTWKAELEWAATRYVFDNRSAYERFIRRHDQSQHYEMAVWQKTEIVDEPVAYLEYLKEFPEAEAAREDWQLPKLDRKIYQVVSNAPDSTYLLLYLKAFSSGEHRTRVKAKLDSIRQHADNPNVTLRPLGDSSGVVAAPILRISDEGKKGKLPNNGPVSTLSDSIISPTKSMEDKLGPVTQPAANDKDQPTLSSSPLVTNGINDRPLAPNEDSLRNINPLSEEEKEQPVKEIAPAAKEAFKGTYGTTKDKQGNTYRTLHLNGLTWMADNLNYEAEVRSWYNKDVKTSERSKFGRLYTWEAAKEACRSFGNGWRLPTDQEWQDMAKYFVGADYDDFNGDEAAYQALIAGGGSGFSAQLGGSRGYDGSFYDHGDYGGYWSATEHDSHFAWTYFFNPLLGRLFRSKYNKAGGYSCRCVQD